MNRDLPQTSARVSSRVLVDDRRWYLAVMALLVMIALVLVPVTHAAADEYEDRDAVNARISAQQGVLNEADAAFLAAQTAATNAHAAWEGAKSELASAQAAQAAAAAARDEATRHDAEMADRLAAAQEALRVAQAEVEAGKAAVDQERLNIGDIGRGVVQQGAPLAGLAAMLNARTTAELGEIEQWNSRLMQAHATAMHRLQDRLAELKAVEEKQAQAEAEATSAKQAAADALAARQQAEAAATAAAQSAAAAEQRVADAAAVSDAAAASAGQAASNERARLQSLEGERAAVEQRIRDRLAREEAERQEAARLAELARQAEERARQAQADAAARAAADKAAADAAAAAEAAKQWTQPAPAPSGNPFVAPVSGPVTSGFGMRLHPVVGIWVLHDGTDYGAGCGTPIRAAAAGRVVENYWDTTGFGNRLIIDHGRIGGNAYSTGYNHASGYIVGVGQWVEQGQVVGYIGSTGYSTGCHLHLNLWVNGGIVDPQAWWF